MYRLTFKEEFETNTEIKVFEFETEEELNAFIKENQQWIGYKQKMNVEII